MCPSFMRPAKKLLRIRARSAVMAGGSWTTKRIVRDLPAAQQEAYAQFFRSPCMMANVALRNWRFLAKMGITGCRWFGGGGLGNYMELRRLATIGNVAKTISPESPVVLTLKVLYSYPGASTEDQGHQGRAEMITTSFREYERRIRQQFTDMFSGAGFDPERDIDRNHFEPVGTRVPQSSARVLLWQEWKGGAARCVARYAIRPNRFCQHRSGGSDGSSLFDFGGTARYRAVT